MAATYGINIDWSNNGVWTNTGEDVTTRVLQEITITYGRDQARALSPVANGSCGFELDNQSRDYSPENSGSPIVGNILPARPVRIQATLSGTTYTLFRGHIDEYTVLPAKDERKVTLTGLDPLAKIAEAKASTALYPSIRTGDAIAAILDSIGWDSRARDLDAGASTLRWWCLNDDDAWSAIQDILKAEGSPSLITADGNGNVVFRDRHHRLFTTLNSNPTFEGSITNWTQFGGTLSLDNTTSHNGQSSAKFVPDGVTAIVGFSSETVAAVAATKYTISGWIMNAVARSISISVNWFTSSMVYISTTSVTQSVAASTWTFFYGELTAPATTAFAALIPTMTGTPAASNIMWADNVRIMAASTSVTTFRDQTTEPKFSAPLVYDQGWRDVVNDVIFTVDERGPASELTEIWASDAVYSIPVGGSLTITVTTDSPFYGAAVSTMTVLSGSAGISINSTAGQTTDIFITDGGSGAQVTGISLVGYVVSALRTFRISSSDSASIAAYGAKSGPDNAGKASVEDAQTIADLTVLTRKVRLPIVQFAVKGSNNTRMNECLNRNLSDRVKVIDAETGLNRDFFIEQITHNIIEAGALHTTTFGCEAVSTATGLDSPTDVFIFDHPTNGKFGTGKFGT